MTQRLTWFRRKKWLFLRAGITVLFSLGIGFVTGGMWDSGCFSLLEAMNRMVSCFLTQNWTQLGELWPDSWPFALGGFLLLTLLEVWIGRALFSPHLATRLVLWELMALVLLLSISTITAFWTVRHVPENGTGFPFPILPALTACLLLTLALCWITRWLLAPLNSIRSAMGEFEPSGGSTIFLSGMPHTELYEVGQLWNQFSLQTQVQLNDLQAGNAAYQRLVPNRLLQMLGKPDIASLKAGDMATQNVSLLVLVLPDSEPDSTQIAPVLHQIVQTIGACGGMVVSHNVEHQALITLFSSQKQARACASSLLDHRLPITAALLQEPVLFGVFGGEHHLLPLAVAPHMARRLALMSMLRQLGAKVICCDGEPAQLRLLGWDDGLPFYEEIRWRGGSWLSHWQDARPMWEQAMALYQQGQFAPAMRRLAHVLSILPEDQAARWYLFRCEALRDKKEPPSHLDLLTHWEACP